MRNGHGNARCTAASKTTSSLAGSALSARFNFGLVMPRTHFRWGRVGVAVAKSVHSTRLIGLLSNFESYPHEARSGVRPETLFR
jgi:hypothetical protein